MTEAKLAPNLPDWMVEHANRYLASGGTDGHMVTGQVRLHIFPQTTVQNFLDSGI